MIKNIITLTVALSLAAGSAAFATDIKEIKAETPMLVTVAASSETNAASITRLSFCEKVYEAINSIKEFPVAKLKENYFSDVASYQVNGLAFSGILSGKEDKIFAPNDALTREEAAVILYRAAKYAGAELPMAKIDVSHSDNAEISEWALSAVGSLRIIGIFDESGAFNPQAEISEKEATEALDKLCAFIKK